MAKQNKSHKIRRVICGYCRKEVRGKVPKSGDGSRLHAVKHKSLAGIDCAGSDCQGEEA